jgi:hypothetical protein
VINLIQTAAPRPGTLLLDQIFAVSMQRGEGHASVAAIHINPSPVDAASLSQMRLGYQRDEHDAQKTRPRRAHFRMPDV